MNLHSAAAAVLTIAATLLLAATTQRAAGDTTTLLGQAGDGIRITTAEAREALAGLQATQDTPLAADPAALGQYVRALLIQRLVLKQAAESKFDQDPATIAKLVRARESALAEAYLEAHSTPPADYPSAAELEEAYHTAKPSLIIPKSWHLAQIFTKDEAKLPAIQKLLSAKGADFAAIAKEHSEEKTTAANGGEIGWLAEPQIQPAIKDKLPALTPGATTQPIKLNDGWHIIKLIASREPQTPTLEQVKTLLTSRLRAERAKQLRAEFITTMAKENPIAINEIELSKILSAP